MYDAGACVYFYFGFNYRGVGNPVKLYEEIEVKNTGSYLWNTTPKTNQLPMEPQSKTHQLLSMEH